MKSREALEFIQTRFSNPETAQQEFGKLSEVEAEELLDRIAYKLPYRGTNSQSIEIFLYYGCARFDRFSVPGPVVIDKQEQSLSLFSRFADALALSEPNPVNAPVFLVDVTLWKTYILLTEKSFPLSEQDVHKLAELRKKLLSIRAPSNVYHAKYVEFDAQRNKCSKIIEAAQLGNLTTLVKTTIPIAPTIGEAVVTGSWKGSQVTIRFKPTHLPPHRTFFAAPGAVVVPVNPSQWQTAVCEIEVTFNQMFDHTGSAPLLHSVPWFQGPFDYGLKLVNTLFELLDSSIWQLRRHQETPGTWLLMSTDIGPLEWGIYANECQIDWVLKDPSAYRITYVKEEPHPEAFELDFENVPSWSERCRILATSFLARGQTNEAMFWLNVGIESLFEVRCKNICASMGIDFSSLGSGPNYWENANRIVCDQFPNLAGKIEWPEGKQGIPSWFSRIRSLDRQNVPNMNASEILRQYSQIQQHRNALFHGSAEGRISEKAVRNALDSFTWLEENFLFL